MLSAKVFSPLLSLSRNLVSSGKRFASCNLSAVLHGKDDLRLEQWPEPNKPGANEVLLETHSVGICGSDIHYWTHGSIGRYILKKPMILGHETSATVIDVGPGVKHLKPGDRVATEPGVPCRLCEFCKSGKYNLCDNIFFFATPPDNGTLTRRFKHAADFCYKLPENVSYEEGALLEPLAVALHACRRCNIDCGDRILITGAGPIGLLNMLTARAFGAAKICMTDVNDERLAFAKSLGADHTLNVKGMSQELVVERVKEFLREPPSSTIECSGSEMSINLAMKVTKSGGIIQLVGMGLNTVTSPLLEAAAREIDIRGVFRYRNCYPHSIDMIANGKINVKPLITHRFKLEETVDAFKTAMGGKAVKVMIKVAQE